MTDKEISLNHDELLSTLHYEPDTGIFTWRKPGKGVRVGAVAGYFRSGGYVTIKLKQEHYQAHRLAWFYVHGTWPIKMVDHVDRDRHNNRISNLREATCKQNIENAKIPVTNTTGYRGVFYLPNRYPNKPYVAKICHHGKCIHVGNYKSAEEASSAYAAVRDVLFTHHSRED